MAAPTVGNVLSDILPYLNVEKQEDAAGQVAILGDMTGLTKKEAEQALKDAGLTGKWEGTGEVVTGQLPAPGQSVPKGSQVLIYFDDVPEERYTTVPDFKGLTRQQASDLAGMAGLYILVSGNNGIEPSVVAAAQDIAPDTQVPVGSTIRLEFLDTKAAD